MKKLWCRIVKASKPYKELQRKLEDAEFSLKMERYFSARQGRVIEEYKIKTLSNYQNAGQKFRED